MFTEYFDLDDPCTHGEVDKGEGEDIVSIFTYLKGIGYIDRTISKTTGKPETIERVIVSIFKNYSEFYHTFVLKFHVEVFESPNSIPFCIL